MVTIKITCGLLKKLLKYCNRVFVLRYLPPVCTCVVCICLQLDIKESNRKLNRNLLSGGPRGYDDHSETSSVRSSGSTAGSANNSSPSSLRGSATSSPCNSPQPASPGATKWQEKDLSASSPHACRYFLMKSNTHKLLDTSYQKGVWGTTGGNEKKLNRAFKVCYNRALWQSGWNIGCSVDKIQVRIAANFGQVCSHGVVPVHSAV